MATLAIAIALTLAFCPWESASAQIPSQDLVRWQSEPQERGTVTLITSCLTTIFLAGWASIHLDVPPQGRSTAAKLRTKLVFASVMLIVPEWLLLRAFYNKLATIALSGAVKQKLEGRETLWTNKHSHLLLMGGFSINTSSWGGAEVIQGSPKLRLTAHGFMVLLQHLHFKEISVALIDGRSKGNWLTKFTACVQAVWMVVQCCARWSEGLPITPLEVRTIAIVVNGIILYGLWWDKPLDLEEPIEIEFNYIDDEKDLEDNSDGKKLHMPQALICLLWMASPISCSGGGTELNGISYNPSTGKVERKEPSGITTAPPESNPLNPGSNGVTAARWALVGSALCHHPNLLQQFGLHNGISAQAGIYVKPLHESFTLRTNDGMAGLSFRFNQLIEPIDAVAVVLLSSLHGGVHALAWNSYFPTSIETHLWRTSVLAAIGMGLSYVICRMGIIAMQGSTKFLDFYRAFSWVIGSIPLTYLLIESFICLREQPKDVYLLPNWTQLIPHV